jgi:type IV pilus assembly protein PilE
MTPRAHSQGGRGATLRSAGFTLIEVVIALAVIAILLALAVPGYQRYLQRADRAEAVRALLAAAACQERVRAAAGYYDTGRCLAGLDSEAWRFRFDPPADAAALAFTVIAEPLRISRDDACGSLSLDQAGTRSISGDGEMGDCWGGR